jgi:DNA polymerase theta
MPEADDEMVEKRMDIVRDLATTSTGLDFTLEKTVSSGVAFHHAGACWLLIWSKEPG